MISKPINMHSELYFKTLIDALTEPDLLVALEQSKMETLVLMKSIPAEKESHAYATGKWNIKQLFQHIVDCERILSYRALSMARKERAALLPFDENEYAMNDNSHALTLNQIATDFENVRNATISLVKSFNKEMLDFESIANNLPMTPRILSWFIAAHNFHHNKIVSERYL